MLGEGSIPEGWDQIPPPQSHTCWGQKRVAGGDALGTRGGHRAGRSSWGCPANTMGQDAVLPVWDLQGWVRGLPVSTRGGPWLQ